MKLLCLSLLAFATAPAAAQDLVAVDIDGTLHQLDSATGCIVNSLPSPGLQEINSMAKRPSDGTLWVAGAWALPGSTLYQLDPTTGAVMSSVAFSGGPDNIRGMAFSPTGRLFVIDDGFFPVQDTLYTVDENTGTATLIGPVGFSGIQALEWEAANSRLLAYDVGNGSCSSAVGLVSINPVSGIGADLDPVCGTSMCNPQGLCFDASGKLWAIGNELSELDPGTGCQNWLGGCSYGLYRGIETMGSGFTLALGGNCPGPMTVTVHGGTPGGSFGLGWSIATGSPALPGGPCAGTVLGLSLPATVVGVFGLDAAGSATLPPSNVGAAACGVIHVQALDLGSCTPSNVVQP